MIPGSNRVFRTPHGDKRGASGRRRSERTRTHPLSNANPRRGPRRVGGARHHFFRGLDRGVVGRAAPSNSSTESPIADTPGIRVVRPSPPRSDHLEGRWWCFLDRLSILLVGGGPHARSGCTAVAGPIGYSTVRLPYDVVNNDTRARAAPTLHPGRRRRSTIYRLRRTQRYTTPHVRPMGPLPQTISAIVESTDH